MAETKIILLIVGKTGNGKSALCNTIVGGKDFATGHSMSSTTLTAQHATTQREGVSQKVSTVGVVDTPDVNNLDMNQQQIDEEIHRWKSLTQPSPTAILLAVRCDVRYTAEEYAVYRQICQLLGDNFVKSRLVVIFTFGDRQDGDIKEELETVCPELKNVLNDAKGRYVVFNNKASESDKADMVRRLLEKVQTLPALLPQPVVQRYIRSYWKVGVGCLVCVLCAYPKARQLIPLLMCFECYWFDFTIRPVKSFLQELSNKESCTLGFKDMHCLIQPMFD